LPVPPLSTSLPPPPLSVSSPVVAVELIVGVESIDDVVAREPLKVSGKVDGNSATPFNTSLPAVPVLISHVPSLCFGKR
jgi:hypothetical protein